MKRRLRAALLAGVFAATACSRTGPRTDESQASAASSEPPAAASAAPAASVSAGSASTPEAPPAPRPPEPLHVVLILIDSMRWDMPWNGYPRNVAPWLTRWEKRVVSYTRAYAVSSTTARSVPALLVGRYPSEMIRNGYYFTRWEPENLFLSERIGKHGHRSTSVHSHAYFFPASGIRQGFDDFHVLPGTVLNNLSEKNIVGERITEAARVRLAKNVKLAEDGGKRLFAYVHYMDPHNPYLGHEDRPVFGTQPRDLYDQEIHYTDQQVGRLITWAKRQPWGKRTAFIVSADHGEAFGEQGHLKHGYELWEELIRVPLLIDAPGVVARRIDVPRSHIDLCATILELMGVAEDPKTRGTSLVGELYGEAPEPRPVIADLTRDNLQDRRRALVDGAYKLIVAGDDKKYRLYDVSSDRRERKELSAKEPELFRRMKRLDRELWAKIPIEPVRGDEPPLKDAPEGQRW